MKILQHWNNRYRISLCALNVVKVDELCESCADRNSSLAHCVAVIWFNVVPYIK